MDGRWSDVGPPRLVSNPPEHMQRRDKDASERKESKCHCILRHLWPSLAFITLLAPSPEFDAF
jgi:hypothetical protein